MNEGSEGGGSAGEGPAHGRVEIGRDLPPLAPTPEVSVKSREGWEETGVNLRDVIRLRVEDGGLTSPPPDVSTSESEPLAVPTPKS